MVVTFFWKQPRDLNSFFGTALNFWATLCRPKESNKIQGDEGHCNVKFARKVGTEMYHKVVGVCGYVVGVDGQFSIDFDLFSQEAIQCLEQYIVLNSSCSWNTFLCFIGFGRRHTESGSRIVMHNFRDTGKVRFHSDTKVATDKENTNWLDNFLQWLYSLSAITSPAQTFTPTPLLRICRLPQKRWFANSQISSTPRNIFKILHFWVINFVLNEALIEWRSKNYFPPNWIAWLSGWPKGWKWD